VRSIPAAKRNERATTQTNPSQADRRADGAFADFLSGGGRTRFSPTDLSMIVARVLKIDKIADGGMPPTYETTH
jgi:hypothetical protein